MKYRRPWKWCFLTIPEELTEEEQEHLVERARYEYFVVQREQSRRYVLTEIAIDGGMIVGTLAVMAILAWLFPGNVFDTPWIGIASAALAGFIPTLIMCVNAYRRARRLNPIIQQLHSGS